MYLTDINAATWVLPRNCAAIGNRNPHLHRRLRPRNSLHGHSIRLLGDWGASSYVRCGLFTPRRRSQGVSLIERIAPSKKICGENKEKQVIAIRHYAASLCSPQTCTNVAERGCLGAIYSDTRWMEVPGNSSQFMGLEHILSNADSGNVKHGLSIHENNGNEIIRGAEVDITAYRALQIVDKH
ncbi:hypothetical protein C8R44DRAFT_732868 [Mycena epipterygia]|nr:hypothetical protein C8R44DRAFT_732868 [Mycena epipterygia]